MKSLFGLFLLVGMLLVTTPVFAAPIVAGSFSTTWDTGVTSAIQINLGVCASAVYWEEIGNSANNGTSTTCGAGSHTTTFPSPGQYRVDYSGDFTTINLSPLGNKEKFRSVEQWGNSTWDILDFAFTEVNTLSFNALDVPNLSETTSMQYMFSSNPNFNEDISTWDVSNVTNMTSMFYYASSFNQPLNSWDVSNVTEFGAMFDNASSFNQPLDNWNVSSAQYMYSMFQVATSFNQPLNNWDVSNVILFSNMFSDTLAFNQPLNNWDLSAAEDIGSMFDRAAQFNQDISSWNVGNITDFFAVFRAATAFNQPLDSWNVSSSTRFNDMFRDATAFNQPLTSWDVSNATDFENMFRNATAFNQPLGSWNISNGTLFENMFMDTSLSPLNYSDILTGWSALPTLGVGLVLDTNAQYCSTAQAARDIFTSVPNNWTINDGGVTECVVAELNDGGGSEGTKVGVRNDRLNAVKDTINSTTTPITVSKSSFIAAVNNFIAYLFDNEEEIANLNPAESKQVIIVLRDIVLQLLLWIPGV